MMKRYYFEVSRLNRIGCIQADGFTEAKQKATREWLPFWRELTWITTENHTHDK